MSESLTLQRTDRFRVAPTPEQAPALARFAGTRRFVWNWALAASAPTTPRMARVSPSCNSAPN